MTEIKLQDAICITNDSILGAIISSYFNDSKNYFGLFRFPVESENRSMYAEMVANVADVLINNIIKKFRPKYVILAGLKDFQKKFFEWVPSNHKIVIDKLEDVDKQLAALNKKFSGEIRSNKNNIFLSLLYAKRGNLKLIYDETYTSLCSTNSGSESIVILEQTEDKIEMLMAVNYTFAIDADLFIVNGVQDDEAKKIEELMIQWGAEHKASVYTLLAKKVRARVSNIKFSNYKNSTFFTAGLPYGFILGNIIPTCHVLLAFTLQYLLFNSIFVEEFSLLNGASVVFSPKFSPSDETKKISEVLTKNNFLVKELLDKEAIVETFRGYVQLFPYDILHISTHGGRTNGYYVIKKFTDKNEQKHSIEYAEVTSFAITDKQNEKGESLIAVTSKFIPQKLDGLRWNSPELRKKQYPQYVFEAAFDSTRIEDANHGQRIKANYFIPESAYIDCYDGFDQGMYHQIAAYTFPIIFNNSCHSWATIARGFLGNGARSYIGTLWNIKNETAIKAAEKFYNILFNKETVLDAFYEMVNSIGRKEDKNIYIFWGLHISTLKTRKEKDLTNFAVHMQIQAEGFLRIIRNSNKDVDVRKNSKDALLFIKKIFIKDLLPVINFSNLQTEIDNSAEEISKPVDLPIEYRDVL